MARPSALVGDALSLGTPQTRSERLIAVSRVALVAVALLALWLEPLLPHADLAHGALAVYLACALVVLAVVFRSVSTSPWLPLATLGLDLAVWPVLMALTGGLSSPFFGYVFLPLFSAMLRLRERGTLWTGALALALFVAMGSWILLTQPTEGLDRSRFALRAALLAVAATLLGAVGAEKVALGARLLRLARGPRSIALYPEELARDALRHAASLEAPRLVMTWEDGEEPWLNFASSTGGEVAVGREAPSTWAPLVAEPLADASFLCEDAGAVAPVVDRETSGRFDRWRGAPLHPGFRQRFRIGPVLSVPFQGAEAEGRLFWLDRRGMTAEDVMLARIVGGQVAPLLDQIHLQRKLRGAAVALERVRLARDLHDGLLQSLGAVGLQLQSALAAVGRNPEVTRERLVEVQRILAADVRDLRLLLGQMKPDPLRGGVPTAPLCERLENLASRIEREWGLRVALDHGGLRTPLGHTLEQQAYLMAHEAVMNAARHAAATEIRVEISAGAGHLRLAVVDDGHGFPFRGRHDGEALTAARVGPVSLRARAAALGGRLVVDSSGTGARVEITVPLGTTEA
jgi:signal transduction histidine kinase